MTKHHILIVDDEPHVLRVLRLSLEREGLVMTSMTASDERAWIQQLQNTEFLEKPLSPRQLVARISRWFAKPQ